MSNYDDDSKAEYRQNMTDWGFDDLEPEDGLEDAVSELMTDLESAPERVGQVIDLMSHGYDLADAVYYAGYGQGTESLHKVLKRGDNGQSVREILNILRDAHRSGRERADAKMAESGA